MTVKADIPLDSYRLANYAIQVPCYVCDEGNSFESEHCRYCLAPMALAHQANSQDVRPLMVAAIGASGVGKTVYLGMLMDMMSRRSGRMQMLARGAFSITLQQTTMAALSRCEFPEKTSNDPDAWNWVHGQIRSPESKGPTEVIMPDMAGEAVLEEIDHPHSYRVVRSLLEKCAGVMILVDAQQLEKGNDEQDFFTMKLLSYLCELNTNGNTGWQQRPISIIFSKADMCSNVIDDPEQFARDRASGLWQHCTERFSKHAFFAAGVAGACAQREQAGGGMAHVPLRIEPRGITEPFEWLIRNI